FNSTASSQQGGHTRQLGEPQQALEKSIRHGEESFYAEIPWGRRGLIPVSGQFAIVGNIDLATGANFVRRRWAGGHESSSHRPTGTRGVVTWPLRGRRRTTLDQVPCGESDRARATT